MFNPQKSSSSQRCQVPIHILISHRLYKVFITEKKVDLVFEYMPYNLSEYLKKFNNTLEKIQKEILFYQIVKAVSYLHSKGIMHRDLKPENILINKEGIPKIADFGLGRRYQLPIGCYTQEVETLYYRAPEILLGTRIYATEIDTWALGCIFGELYKGEILFKGDSEIGQITSIFQILGTPNEETWPGISQLEGYKIAFQKYEPDNLEKLCPGLDPDGLDLLKKMLTYNPLKRICLKDALEHPFFGRIKGV